MQAEALSTLNPLIDATPDAWAALIAHELAPKVSDIDLKGEYPESFLRALGVAGGYAGAADDETGLAQVIRAMEEASRECVSTGFLIWCQSACTWYLHNSANAELKLAKLPAIARGEMLAGTGLSNPMKSCAAIEPIRLQAQRVSGGYVINGSLPWVSNIGPGHCFAFGAGVATRSELLLGLISCDVPGLTLNQNAHFVALEGTHTFACHFKEVFIADADVIAHPDEFDHFITRIKSGFILNQMGMALGLVDACVAMMRQSNKTLAHVNCYLDDQADEIASALQQIRAATYDLARKISVVSRHAYAREVIQLRIAGSELALKAANAAMLHLGAKGYLLRNPAQRRLREAYFIAIVTPALKHLRMELAKGEHAAYACET